MRVASRRGETAPDVEQCILISDPPTTSQPLFHLFGGKTSLDCVLLNINKYCTATPRLEEKDTRLRVRVVCSGEFQDDIECLT